MKATTPAALLMLLGACLEPRTQGLTDEEFIAATADLRRAAITAGTDTAQFDSLRNDVLERHGVTDAELRAFVESPDRDLRELADIWDSVGARLTGPQ